MSSLDYYDNFATPSTWSCGENNEYFVPVAHIQYLIAHSQYLYTGFKPTCSRFSLSILKSFGFGAVFGCLFSLPPQPASTRLAPSSQGCWVCPILSWHHQSWDPEPDLQGRGEIRSSHGSTWCVWEKGGRITLMIWQLKILCYGVILSNNIQYIRDYHHPNYHLTWNNGDMVGYTTTMAIRYVWALGIDRFTI